MEDEQEGVSIMGNFSSRWQYVLDKIIPYVTARWISLSIIIYIYALRVYFANGWYVVTYGLGIYLLNQLVGFISPQVRLLFMISENREGQLEFFGGIYYSILKLCVMYFGLESQFIFGNLHKYEVRSR